MSSIAMVKRLRFLLLMATRNIAALFSFWHGLCDTTKASIDRKLR